MAGVTWQDNGGGEQPLRLVIGDKNYSSWSLRPWLLMRQSAIPFEETAIRLRQPETKAAILALSPSGKVPALIIGGRVVWDSLAIAETLSERFPERNLWPEEASARAHARSISAEMHSGFADLRCDMPMDWARRLPMPNLSPPLEADIARVVAIWRDCRARHGSGGPFLFGAFSVADAMYAPVASRFRTYGVELRRFGDNGSAAAYADAVLALPALDEWTRDSEAEIAAHGRR